MSSFDTPLFLPFLEKEKTRRHLPPGTGKYSVGCLDYMCDINNAEGGSLFRLYYPIERTDIYKRDKQWPLWLPRKQYGEGYANFSLQKIFKDINIKMFGKLLNWMGGDVYAPVLWQSPPSPCGRKFPVVIFSHGIGGNRTTNTTYCCEMASHGFIVAAVEHRDGSASMTYHLTQNMNGKVVSIDENNNSKKHTPLHRTHSFREEWKPFERFDPWDDWNYRNKQVNHRYEECRKTLDIMISLNNGDFVHNALGGNFNSKLFKGTNFLDFMETSVHEFKIAMKYNPLEGRMDLSRVVISGHSFGGSTCLCTLSRDKRFKLGVVLDGWMHPLDKETDYEGVDQPLLMVNSETFQWRDNVKDMKQILKESTDVLITIKGTCHQSCTDFQFLLSKPLGRFLDIRYTLSPKIAMGLCNKASLGFMRKHLDLENKNFHDDILNGEHELVILGTNVEIS